MKSVLYAVLVAVAALSVLVGYQFRDAASARRDARRETCLKLAALDRTLISLVKAGEKSLPRLTYYRAHPAELRLVLANDERTIRVLTPPDYC